MEFLYFGLVPQPHRESALPPLLLLPISKHFKICIGTSFNSWFVLCCKKEVGMMWYGNKIPKPHSLPGWSVSNTPHDTSLPMAPWPWWMQIRTYSPDVQQWGGWYCSRPGQVLVLAEGRVEVAQRAGHRPSPTAPTPPPLPSCQGKLGCHRSGGQRPRAMR